MYHFFPPPPLKLGKTVKRPTRCGVDLIVSPLEIAHLLGVGKEGFVTWRVDEYGRLHIMCERWAHEGTCSNELACLEGQPLPHLEVSVTAAKPR